eukprot:contig_21409_g5267
MLLESYVCAGKGCETRVFPDGRDTGLVIWSASTAATAVVMRDMAREMCTSGSTFGACYRHWKNKYVDLRDSGFYSGMAKVPGRSRQTGACLFFHSVNLMTMEPPLWAFSCSTCQDKDGRWRIITADGIWLGYLKRLASGQFKNATQESASVLQTVHAASLHPSEWVRRFMRTALKQPTKAVVIKGEQLNSAKRALRLMCPAALPSMSESRVSEEKRLGMTQMPARQAVRAGMVVPKVLQARQAMRQELMCLWKDHIMRLNRLYKDISSYCVAMAADPVVNMFKPRHCEGLTAMASLLNDGDCADRLDAILAGDGRSEDDEPQHDEAPLEGRDAPVAHLLAENSMLFCLLAAVSSNTAVFKRLHSVVAEILLAVRATVEDYHVPRPEKDKSSVRYQQAWGDPSVSREELRRRSEAAFPGLSEDPHVTGAFFPSMKRCRPSPFIYSEEPELGTCAKNYQDVHKYFSPGTFTICCACSHPKMIGFVVLDKREGPPALLSTILSYSALLPHFIVYDFGCGALRSALGKLPFFLALVILVSDLFHIVNHLCSDALHPRSYTGMDGANSVAHEQRKSPFNLMRRSLRACGQDEHMSIMQLENIFYNVMAHARSTSAVRLHEDYNWRQFYFSRAPCCCPCEYQPAPPPVPASTPTQYGQNATELDSDASDGDW